jgi:hypothetical protein
MKTRAKGPWLLAVLFAAMCIAAIASDCAAGESGIWVSYLSPRLSGNIDGRLGGMTFQLHLSLTSPLSLGLTIESSAAPSL